MIGRSRRLPILALVPAVAAGCIQPAAATLRTPSPAAAVAGAGTTTSVTAPAASASRPTPTPVRSERPATGGTVGGTGARRPAVSVEPLADGRYRVTVADPTAKAWRVVVRGVQELADASLAIVVVTGDVGYGVEVDRDAGTGPAGRTELDLDGPDQDPVCEATLHACVAPGGIRTAGQSSDGTLRVDLVLDATVPVELRAGTAAWGGEPFVLGAWADSEPLTLGG